MRISSEIVLDRWLRLLPEPAPWTSPSIGDPGDDDCDYDDSIGIYQISENSPTLIKMIDVLGREKQEHNPGSLLFYIYDNGLVEKRVTH